MSKTPTKFTRRHKLLLASLATVSLSLGATGVVYAQSPAPASSGATEEVDGVDCENGLDAVTGAECDGGPAANPQDGADDATEEGSEAAGE